MSRCREGRTRAGTGTEVGSAIRLVGGPDDDAGVGPRGIGEDGWAPSIWTSQSRTDVIRFERMAVTRNSHLHLGFTCGQHRP